MPYGLMLALWTARCQFIKLRGRVDRRRQSLLTGSVGLGSDAAMGLAKVILQEIRRHSLIRPGSSGAVAFSGGADSLCLLAILAELKDALSVDVIALHVDHGLRSCSAEDARNTMRLADKLNVKAEVLTAPRFNADDGNKQQWARDRRRELLQRFAEDRELAWIATAHHADDQAETVLMRVLRGSGLRGLGAMAWRSASFIRPLLGTQRGQIDAYLSEKGLTPVEDPTNATDLFLRNRLRRQILPLLKKENPALVATLCRLAANCREEEEALAAVTSDLYAGLHDAQGISTEGLRELSTAMQHRVIAEAFYRIHGHRQRLERSHLEDVATLLTSDDGSRSVSLPGAVAERRYGRLVLSSREGRHEIHSKLSGMKIPGPGRYDLSDGSVLLVEEVVAEAGEIALRLEGLLWPLTLRSAEPGDRITIGNQQSSKVSKLFQDRKVPNSERHRVPLLLAGGEIVSVVGIRSAFGRSAKRAEEAVRITRIAAAEPEGSR
jgi:tRNA(Ile)-lysidine synthase